MKNIQPIPKKKNCEQKTTVQSAKNDIFNNHLPRLAKFTMPSEEKRNLHEDLRRLRRLIGKCDVSDRNFWIPNWPIRSLSGHFKCCRPPRVGHFTNNSSNTEDLHCLEILVFNRFGARFSFYQTLLKFCTLKYCANIMAAVGRLGNVSVFFKMSLLWECWCILCSVRTCWNNLPNASLSKQVIRQDQENEHLLAAKAKLAKNSRPRAALGDLGNKPAALTSKVN